MTTTSTDTTAEAEWTEALEGWVKSLNDIAGKTGPAPLFADSPYAFPVFHSHVTPDIIRQFARANGDMNPLWNDEAYATASAWGGLIAPPGFEACISEAASMPIPAQIRGMNSMIAGCERRYNRPFRVGDVIHAVDTWRGVEEKQTRDKPYRLFLETADRDYINQDGEVVCTVSSRVINTATPPGLETQPYAQTESRRRRKLTDEEFDEIRRSYEAEISGAARRGADPRYWEDVNVGDEITPMVKGPYDISDAVAIAGVLGVCSGFASRWQEIAGDLDRRPFDPETGFPHHPIDWHFQDKLAQQFGLPYAQAFGTHLEAMLLHFVSNWMSDDAWIVRSDVQIRDFLFLGDVTRFQGEITNKREENGELLVDIAATGVTFDGIQWGRGTVTVALPSRSGESPAQRRARAAVSAS